MFTGIDVAANLQAARDAAMQALSLFELKSANSSIQSVAGGVSKVSFAELPYLSSSEQRQIVEGNYELLLVLA